MKLNKLIIKNFLSVQDATLILADKGLVSIEGVNEDGTGADSNGSGKSSIMNAILWCNYDDCGKPDVFADSVVNDKAGKDCMVQCYWQEMAIQYRITRYRKHKVHKNAVTVEVKHGSKDWLDITKAGKEIQLQINGILGQDLPTFKASCFAAQEEAPDIPKMTDSKLKQLLESTLPFEELDGLFVKAKDNYSAQLTVVDRLKSQITFNESTLSYKRDEGRKAYVAMGEWAEDVKEHDNKIEAQIHNIKSKFVVAAINPVEFMKLKKEIKKLEEYINAYDPGPYNKIVYEIDSANSQLYQLDAELMEETSTCYACGQLIESYEDQKKHTQDRKDKITNELFKFEAIKKKLQSKHTGIEIATSKLATMRRQLDGLGEAERTNAVLERQIATLQGQKRAGLANPHKETVTRLKAEFDATKATLKTLKEELAVEEEKLPILEAVMQTFSPKGVRYHILEEVTPFLNERTNYYLNQLTDNSIGAVWSTVTQNKTGEYKEKFSIQIKLRGLTEYGLLSGGEKRKVKLACFFALQDLIAKRATKNIDIWCGDEIDEALDTAGLERLMVLLDEKTRVKSTILVISHNDLRDWIPNHAIVTRKDDISTITGYLN